MTHRVTHRSRASIGGLLALFAATALVAQTTEQRAQCEREYAPQSGQPGKDVVWVPTPDHLVLEMLKVAETRANDIVYDLGAGDGKIAIAAAKEFGARAVGVEYNPGMVKLAQCLTQASGVGDKVKIVHGDVFKVDFSEATVVTLYLLPALNEKLAPTILKMRPGTRVVSHSFMMGDWEPDEQKLVLGVDRVFFWVVPAQAKGTWELTANGRKPVTMRLKQQYQALEGVLIEGAGQQTIQDGHMRGDQISFKFGKAGEITAVNGKVKSDELAVTFSGPGGTATYFGSRR